MYYTIHSMKNQGFSKRQIAEMQQIDFRTVVKRGEMRLSDFVSWLAQLRDEAD